MEKVIAPLSADRHSGKCWCRFTSYEFASQSQFAPMVGAEVAKAVQNIPLCFVRKEDGFHLGGLLSPKPGDNYFVGLNGRWLGAYVPACFRSYPFQLGRLKNQQKLILCVDESCGLISETEGDPLFEADGQLAASVSQVLNFLQHVEKNRMATRQAVDGLAQAGLIAEWPLGIEMDGQKIRVEGIYKFDETKLKTLSDEAFLNLRGSLALSIGYAQLFSMGSITIFSKLAEIRKQQQPEKSAETEMPMEFGIDDMIKF